MPRNPFSVTSEHVPQPVGAIGQPVHICNPMIVDAYGLASPFAIWTGWLPDDASLAYIWVRIRNGSGRYLIVARDSLELPAH